MIHFGIESGSQQILDRIGKGIDVETNRQAILMTKHAGIRAFALMMTGNIGETIDETIDETIGSLNASVNFLRETDPDQFLAGSGLILYPGTEDYQYTKRKGYIDDDFWLRKDESTKIFCLEYSEFQLHIFRFALQQLKTLSNKWWLNYIYYFLYRFRHGQLSWKGFVWYIAPEKLQNILREYIKPVLKWKHSEMLERSL